MVTVMLIVIENDSDSTSSTSARSWLRENTVRSQQSPYF